MSAVAAPAAQFAGKTVAGWFGGEAALSAAGYNGTKFARDVASNLTTSAVRSAFGGKFEVSQVVADVFGNALGNSIVDRMAPQPAMAAGQARSGLNLDAEIEAGIASTRARNEAELLGMAAPTLDNNPRLIDPSRTLTPDQRVAQESSARQLAEAVQRIPDPPANLQTLEEVVVTAPRELNPYAENFLQSRGDFYQSLMLSNWSTRQRAAQTPTYVPEIDRSLYVAPGFFKSAYDIAATGFDDPNSTLLDKSVYFLGAVGTALPMMAEEAGRFILNAADSASVGGQLLARGNLATDTDTKVESYLGAVSSFANAFNGFAALTPPSLMLPGSVPNLNAVPAVTMSAEELAAVRATYARVDADTIYTFRGDTLAPEVVFNRGFAARGSSTDLYLHAVDNANPPSAYVPTSQSFDVAADFASGFGTRAGNVYVVRPTNGIDVNRALGSRSPYPTEFEVAIPVRILPSDIRAVTPLNPDGSLTGISILNPAFK